MFILTIEIDAAVYDGSPNDEVARILRCAANLLNDGYTSHGLDDIEGNKVGSFALADGRKVFAYRCPSGHVTPLTRRWGERNAIAPCMICERFATLLDVPSLTVEG